MISNREQNQLRSYQIVRPIAEGMFGKVFQAKDIRNGKKVAIKQMIHHENQGPGLQTTSIREISLIKSLNNQNIIKIKGIITNQPNLFIVLELMNSDLKSLLRRLGDKKLDKFSVKKYMYQLINAINCCHERKIIHRDLKPQNILIDAQQNLKVADFGLARKIYYPPRPYTLGVVTQPYRAPQVLLDQAQYTQKIDIWSIGCIFAQLLTNKIFFPPDSNGVFTQLTCIFRKLGTPTEEEWPGWTQLLRKFEDSKRINLNLGFYNATSLEDQIGSQNLEPQGFNLLKKMLALNPENRISAVESLNHPYFNDLNE